MIPYVCLFAFFFFNDTATTEIYTLSLHDALPISRSRSRRHCAIAFSRRRLLAFQQIGRAHVLTPVTFRNLVCRLLLEKKTKQWSEEAKWDPLSPTAPRRPRPHAA